MLLILKHMASAISSVSGISSSYIVLKETGGRGYVGLSWHRKAKVRQAGDVA